MRRLGMFAAAWLGLGMPAMAQHATIVDVPTPPGGGPGRMASDPVLRGEGIIMPGGRGPRPSVINFVPRVQTWYKIPATGLGIDGSIGYGAPTLWVTTPWMGPVPPWNGGIGYQPYAVPVPMPYAVPVPVNTNLSNQVARPAARRTASKVDPVERGKDLVRRGDRYFKSGKRKLAVERYESAIKADPSSFDARARLAGAAFARGDYAESAKWIHEAVAASPQGAQSGSNVEAMFGEPKAFDAAIDQLETHLQANPEDDNGWLVLGVQRLLSDAPDKAADALLRIDAKPGKEDPTLAPLLRAVNARMKF